MSHGPYRFRESELRRAIKAARSAGIEIDRFEIGTDGRIVVFPGKPAEDGSDIFGTSDAERTAVGDIKDLI